MIAHLLRVYVCEYKDNVWVYVAYSYRIYILGLCHSPSFPLCVCMLWEGERGFQGLQNPSLIKHVYWQTFHSYSDRRAWPVPWLPLCPLLDRNTCNCMCIYTEGLFFTSIVQISSRRSNLFQKIQYLLVVVLWKAHTEIGSLGKRFNAAVTATYDSPLVLEVLIETLSIANKDTSMFCGKLVKTITVTQTIA